MTTTNQRGYGLAHKQERQRWLPVVQSGQAQCSATVCLMPSRTIKHDEAWDLGHTPDRSAYTGPEHVLCNRSEGAKRRDKGRVLRARWVL